MSYLGAMVASAEERRARVPVICKVCKCVEICDWCDDHERQVCTFCMDPEHRALWKERVKVLQADASL